MRIRTSIKAIIHQNESILFIKKQDKQGYYYLLPGGGQENGESMTQAIIRECREEVTVDVEVGEVLYVRDYIDRNHKPEGSGSDFHQVEIMFQCHIKNGQEPQNGSNPDPGQVDVDWIALDELDQYRIYPKAMIKFLQQREKNEKIYLGDVN
jgi:ADP-ribose pyrophosphatase YjhB (NUDIX family)